MTTPVHSKRLLHRAMLAAVLAALLTTACSSDATTAEAEQADVSESVAVNTITLTPLTERAGARTETSHSVPHVQVLVDPVAEIDAELRRRIYSLPAVENRETIISFTGTTALWLGGEFDPSEMAATMREREFAHIHPDGSLHAVLPVDRAIEATNTKWAELHPWVGREDFWDGMVMLYTPQNGAELEVTWQLVVDSYNFVTGQTLAAADFID